VKWREDVSEAGIGFCLIKNSSEKYGLYKRRGINTVVERTSN